MYYYMLTATDEGRAQAYPQLLRLWQNRAQAIDILKRQREADPFNDGMDSYIGTIADDSLTRYEPKRQIERLAELTEKLFAHTAETGEQNMDFFQLHYGDLYSELHKLGYETPMTVFMADAVHHTEALKMLTDKQVGTQFNEFRMWAEVRLSRGK